MSCVLTLALDAASQAWFEDARTEWFPPERNQIPAHLTLFHTLPEEPWINDILSNAAKAQASLTLHTPEPRSIGRGVAFFLQSHDVKQLHGRLRSAFGDVITAQDRQGFRPHVVIQNKASAEQARVCLAAMQRSSPPQQITATGLTVWRYLNGPWQHLQTFAFQAPD